MANSLIDFGVIQPDIALKPFERARQQAQQEQQNQLAALQLRAAQRGEEEALASREAYKSPDPVKALFAAGLGTQAIQAAKAMQEQKAAQLKQAQDSHKFAKGIVEGIVATPTRENATRLLDWAESQGADMSQYRAELAQTPDAGIGKWAFTHGVGADKALEQAIIQLPGGGTAVEPKYALGGISAVTPMPTPAAAPMAAPMTAPAMPAGVPGQTPMTRNALAQAELPAPGMPIGAVPTPTGGRYYPPAMTPQQQVVEAREQTRIGLEQRRVELAEKEAARKAEGMAEPLSKKEIQTREAKYPQATKAVQTFDASADEMLKDLEKLRDHPGLNGISGFIYGRTPGVKGASREAEAIYDKIIAKGGFSELQEMRNASPTGGALGNVSNQENLSLRASFAAIDRRQDPESIRRAINDAIIKVQGAKERVRDAYNMTYEYKGATPAAPAQAGKPAAPAAPAAGGSLSPAEQAELEQLRARFGKRGVRKVLES